MTREEIQKITDDYARSLKTRKQPAATATDGGFGQPERTEAAFNDIRRHIIVHSVQSSIKRFLTQRNEAIRRTKKKQKENENANVSHPFWY